MAGGSVEDAVERGPVSLNDMFREVEMLMEDTQQMLEEAVDQVRDILLKNVLTFTQLDYRLWQNTRV